MSSHTENLTDAEFESKVSASKGLVMVDFWAEWCGPCKVLGPVIEDLARAHVGALRVYKMDVDENQASPSALQVRGIPTVVIFKDGKVVDQIVGSLPREVFEKAIQSHLKPT